jgi:hypothetical protein
LLGIDLRRFIRVGGIGALREETPRIDRACLPRRDGPERALLRLVALGGAAGQRDRARSADQERPAAVYSEPRHRVHHDADDQARQRNPRRGAPPEREQRARRHACRRCPADAVSELLDLPALNPLKARQSTSTVVTEGSPNPCATDQRQLLVARAVR